MREYFVVMIKEGSTENLKLLTEKLNAGFYIDNRYDVGRSLMITLRKDASENELRGTSIALDSISVAGAANFTYAGTIPF